MDIIVLIISVLMLWAILVLSGCATLTSVSIDVCTFYVCGWFLYGVVPLFVSIYSDSPSWQVSVFSLDVFISIFAWLFGVIFYRFIRLVVLSKNSTLLESYKINLFPWIFFVIVLLYLYMKSLYGDTLSYLISGYGSYNKSGVNSFTSSVPFIISGVLFYLYANTKSRFVSTVIIFFTLLFFLGGNRNVASFMLIGFVYINYYGCKVSIFKSFVIIVVLLSLSSFIAVSREVGVVNAFMSGDQSLYQNWIRNMLRYNYGEFGVMYRHVEYSDVVGGSFETTWFNSYFFSPIINMIPTFIWPNRPSTNSVLFTNAYWGNAETLKSGLGFSVINEAKLSLGSLYFIVFFVCGYFFVFLSNNFKKNRSPLLMLISGSIAAACLNFFRIDFAVYFKFIILTSLSGLFVYKISRIKL